MKITHVGQEVTCPECRCRAEVTKLVYSFGTRGYWATLSCSCGEDWGEEIWCGDGFEGAWILAIIAVVLITVIVLVRV